MVDVVLPFRQDLAYEQMAYNHSVQVVTEAIRSRKAAIANAATSDARTDTLSTDTRVPGHLV